MAAERHDDGRRAALVLAHPGHELRVHHWMERERPVVCVLTDGSGNTGRSRLPSTTRTLAGAGAVPGPLYGVFTDRECYAALRDRDFATFLALARGLADFLIAGKIGTIVGDAAEGYNPSHDVCRLLIGAAAERAARERGGAPIASYDFPLIGAPDSCPEARKDGATRLHLDDAALERKITAALTYPEMAGEVQAALAAVGREAFRVECLRPATSREGYEWLADEPPYYERHGERRVADGHYDAVIRYREHVRPLAEALREWAGGGA